jgi:hypothetical protein
VPSASQTSFDRARIEALVQAIADELEGDWLLIGGALVALWLEPDRTTEDIDLIGLRGEPSERYALLDFAARSGLPIESINSAADFFVQRIPGWREQVEVLLVGARGRILRPTPTLFLLLKIGRLSERDLADCLAAVAAAGPDAPLDPVRVKAALAALPPADPAAAERRTRLLAVL